MTRDAPSANGRAGNIVAAWRRAVRDDPSLGANAKHVALTLATYMDAAGGSCFPGVEEVTLKTGRGRRTVQYGLRELERAGYLCVDLHRGRGHTNSYQATFPGAENALRERRFASENAQGATGKRAKRDEKRRTYGARSSQELVREGADAARCGPAAPLYIDEECFVCGTRTHVAMHDGRGLLCDACARAPGGETA